MKEPQITYLYTAAHEKTNRGKYLHIIHMQQNHLLLMSSILNKMATFFAEVAQECMQHASPSEQTLQHQLLPQNTSSHHHPNASPPSAPSPHQTAQGEHGLKSHKPKHPVSSFFIFYKEKGQEIARQRGEVLGSKIAKIVGELWQGMTEADKEPYQAQSKVARQKYEEEMTHYKINYTEEIAKLKRLKRMARLKRKETEEIIIAVPPKLAPEEAISEENEDSQLQNNSSSGGELVEGLSDDLSDNLKDFEQLGLQISENQIEKEILVRPDEPSSNGQSQLQEPSDGELTQLDILEDSIDNSIKDSPKVQCSKLPQQTPSPTLVQPSSFNLSASKSAGGVKTNHEQLNRADEEVPADRIVKPKGPVSSFFIFYKAKKNEISERERIPIGPRVIKKASQVWNLMTSEEKQVYEQQAKETRIEYYRQMGQLKRKYGQTKFTRKKSLKGGNPGRKRGRFSKL